MSKTFTGTVQVFARDDIDTDLIIPAKHLNTSDHALLAEYVLEPLGGILRQAQDDKPVIVAGANFGCGSSREHAVWALSGAGVQVVIAESFARIFFRNSINFGLLPVQLPDAAKKIGAGDELEIDATNAKIKNLTKNEEYAYEPLPSFLQEIVNAGGLLDQLQANPA
jgi:3-isopropylmalate/(R)-2-methylmalate dehydratase small subunit